MRRLFVLLLLAACATHRVSREQLQPSKRVIVQNGVDAIVDDQLEFEVPPPQPPPPPPPGPPEPPGGGGDGDNGCEWAFVGPTNIHGRVLDIAIDPTNRNHLFIATVGGVWRSTDFARQWERVTDDLYAGAFGTVAINPTTPTEVFIGGGDPNLSSILTPSRGIWRSISGGGPGSFVKTTPQALDDSIVYRLRVDAKLPHDVYAATSSGLWRGEHSGGNIDWSLFENFNVWTSDVVLDDSVTPTLVYAAAQTGNASFARGIWKWDGAQWLAKSTGIDTTQSRQIRVALAKSSPNTLYARVENTSFALQGVYKTTTGANAWQKLGNVETLIDVAACSPNYMASMEVDPSDANRVYAGCLTLFRTTTGNANWSDVSGGADPAWQYWLHVDHHAIAFDPVNPKIVYVGHDGGLDRSTDTSLPVWHWTDVSHGLNIWQLYRVSGHHDMPTLAAGGAQDTGTAFTFGNRSWYHQWDCDGRAVEHDSGNAETLYVGCAGIHVQIRTNPVPGTPGYSTTVLPVPDIFAPPVVIDRDLPGRVLARSGSQCGANIMMSVDGVNFSPIGSAPDRLPWALHAVPGTSFQHYYAGMLHCGNSGVEIWRTTTGGPPWDTASNGLPQGIVLAITADPANGAHAFAVFEQQVLRTIDGGANWTSIEGVAPDALPVNARRRAVAVDPIDPNIVYVATDVGPFKGTLGATTTWEPFDAGLPAGVDVRDIHVDENKKALVIGTWGYGIYRRELDPAALCPAHMLLVRDNVFDRGASPSTPQSGFADPEHPVPDPGKPPFFLADSSGAGRLFWWSSTDVRIDVPDADPPQNLIADADHVELETCPILIMDCPPGTMIDSHPRRGKLAHAYVQVTNGGKEPVANARVIALWTDTTASTPLLPIDFWSATFPTPDTPCGAIAAGSPWHLVDPLQPCRTIAQIDPPMPELARFDWNVPQNAPEKACFLTIVESLDDPLPGAIRANNQRDLWNIVPQNRHMTVRNLHFVDPPMMASQGPSKLVEVIAIPNPTPDDGIQIVISQDFSGGRLRILLPRELDERALEGIRKVPARLTDEEKRLVSAEKLDPRFVYEVASKNGVLMLPVKSGETWRMGLSTEATPPARLDVIAVQGHVVLGGSSYLFRERVRRQGFPRLTGTLH